MAPTDTTTEKMGKATWKPPVDPGDAGGVGNGSERSTPPDTMHDAPMSDEDVAARETFVREIGR